MKPSKERIRRYRRDVYLFFFELFTRRAPDTLSMAYLQKLLVAKIEIDKSFAINVSKHR